MPLTALASKLSPAVSSSEVSQMKLRGTAHVAREGSLSVLAGGKFKSFRVTIRYTPTLTARSPSTGTETVYNLKGAFVGIEVSAAARTGLFDVNTFGLG
jgi:hypothetical protein